MNDGPADKQAYGEEIITPQIRPHHSFGRSTACSVRWRYTVVFMAWMANACTMGSRVNLSVAIIAMVNHSALRTKAAENASLASGQCIYTQANETTPDDGGRSDGEFIWDQKTQGLILGSYFYGYLLMQVPAGWLSSRYSGKWTAGLGIFSSALLTLLVPVAARTGIWLLITVRVLQGLGWAVATPSSVTIMVKWSPPMERTVLVACGNAGSYIGIVPGILAAGFLCNSGFAGGWPSVFYIFGSTTVVWFILWCVLVYDSPEQHPCISSAERDYIHQSLGKTPSSERQRKTPWKAIFTSRPFLILLLTHVANNWGYFTMLNSSPQFLADILHMDIEQNGMIAAFPYVGFFTTLVVGAISSDFLRRRGWLSTTSVRKLVTATGELGAGISLVLLGHSGCDRGLAIAWFFLSIAFVGFTDAGYNVNHADLSPSHAGLLYGITNCAAAFPGIGGPYFVGLLTKNQPTRDRWQIVFYLAAAIHALAAVCFLGFGSGVRQPWDDPHHQAKGRQRKDAENQMKALVHR